MISLKKVWAGYEKSIVLKDVSFSVEKGFLGILGPNGSGKTTLLKVISKIVNVKRGSVYIMGKDIRDYKRRELARILTLVSQDFMPIYNYKVSEMVEMGRIPYGGIFPVLTDYDHKIVERVMEDLDISHLKDRLFLSLSSGEKRMVMLARAVAQDVKVLLVDELELHLDPAHKAFIATFLKRLSESGKIIISVFHDIDLALEFSDRLIGLKDGRVFFDLDSSDEKLAGFLEKLYGVPFVSQLVKGRRKIFPWYH